MGKLNQVIAVLNGVKSRTKSDQTKIYQLVQKSALFQGVTRTFSPRDEDGHVYPAESQLVQLKVKEVVDHFVSVSSELLDIALTQDCANTQAVVDIKVGGQTIAAGIPVTNLLFLEDRVQEFKDFVESLPALPIDKEWTYDPNKSVYSSSPRETTKTKKITDWIVGYEATKEHPAQLKEVSKDIVEGTWTTVDLNGGLPSDVKAGILKRIDLLQQAVIKARQEANGIDAPEKKIASALFAYIFDTIV
jgi:hypothetical protein